VKTIITKRTLLKQVVLSDFMALHLFIFIVGLILLYFGAEWMVRGSSLIARSFGIRPIIIGLTIVAFGTSAPEACVSIIAVINETKDIALGNIIGSNIANIGLILGISALVAPLRIDRPILKRELPILIVVSLVLYGMCLDGVLGLVEGLVLLTGIIAFIGFCCYSALNVRLYHDNDIPSAVENERTLLVVKNGFLTLFGLLGLVAGSHGVVTGSIYIARVFGISELVIGMSLVAIGTSLPELATSIVASYRKESEICVGNVVGSNLFNILFVIGVVATMSTVSIKKSVLSFEFPIMLLFTAALFPFMKSGFTLTRKEGAVLFGAYLVFMYFLF